MYSLSWGDFGSSLASTFQILRGQGELVDVTLSAGGRIFPAHKLVLSAASPLLMELLKSTQCQHPVVMLAGITASDLEALLAFIYQGEVSVDPSQLPSLLQAAHCLDITALSPTILSTDKPVFVNHPPEVVVTPSTVDMSSVSNTSMMHSDESSSALPVRKRKQVKRKSSELPNTSMGEKWARVGEENTDPVQASMSDSMVSVKHEGSGEEGGAKKLVSDLPVECSVCGVILRQSRNLRRHMELIHFKVGPKLPRGRRSLKGKSLMSLELNTADNVSNSEQNDDPLAVSESEVKLCISSNEAQTSPMVHSAIVSPEPSSSHSMSQSPHPSPAQIIHTSRSSSTDQNHSPLPTHVLTAPVVTQQIRPHLITPQMYQIPTSAQSQIEIHHTQNAPVTICDSLQTTFIPTQAMTFTTQDSNTFRQQNEILRGALYSDTREHCQTE